MQKRFRTIGEVSVGYGGTPSAWRKWILLGQLGDAVVRFGRLVMLDTAKLEQRLAETGQLLSGDTCERKTATRNQEQ